MSELRRNWVEPVGSLGLRVMIDGGCFGRRSIGFWHRAVEANAAAREPYRRSRPLNEAVAEDFDLPTLSPTLWEGLDEH